MRVYNWTLGPLTLADIEEQGIWLGSELGVSFVCACNWRSGIMPTPADVRDALGRHATESHGLGRDS